MERACDCRRLNSCPHCTLLTVEQVAERTARKPATIRQWIRVHEVRSWTDRTGTYVIEAEVLECERERRHAIERTRSLTKP